MTRPPIKRRTPQEAEEEQEELTRRLSDASYAQKAFQADKVLRSRRSAIDAAVKFRKTGEGTMAEAATFVIDQNRQKRRERRNPPPRREGAQVLGIKRNTSPV